MCICIGWTWENGERILYSEKPLRTSICKIPDGSIDEVVLLINNQLSKKTSSLVICCSVNTSGTYFPGIPLFPQEILWIIGGLQ